MELSIRAWDAQAGKMVYDLSEMKGTVPIYVLCQNNDKNIEIIREVDCVRLPTMLGLGVEDMTGGHMFEGDIIRFKTTSEFQNHKPVMVTAVVCWDTEDCGMYFKTDKADFPYLKPWFADHIAVIGNIYENPELYNATSTTAKTIKGRM